MSAWLCSHLHIKALAIYATTWTGRVIHQHTQTAEGKWIKAQVDEFPLVYLNAEEGQDLADPTTVARILMTENIKSVCHRYDEEEAHYYWQELTVDITPADKTHFHTLRLSPIQLIKLIHCCTFQSSEHPDWEASLAKTILMVLEDHLIRELPGYEDAAWSLHDDNHPNEQKPRVHKSTHP